MASGGASTDTWTYDGQGNLTDHTRGSVDTVYVPEASNPEKVGLLSVNGRARPATRLALARRAVNRAR